MGTDAPFRNHARKIIAVAALESCPHLVSAPSGTASTPIRGCVSVSTNKFGGTGHCGLDGHQVVWNERPEIGKPVRLRLKHNDGDREAIQILLKGQVSIHSDEHVEVFRSKRQQRAILDRRPTHLTGRFDVVADNVAREPPIDTFVEKHLYDAASIIRSFACSRKAMTCSRVTDGNPSRKSSIDSPASR
jgi:hypothetical protein